MKRILCVEDNDSYRSVIANDLTNAGYIVDAVDSPVKGLEMLVLKSYDLVISDLKLPVMSGVVFTESVKNVSPSTLCIILTGEPDEISELQSIKNNVDLYIEKNKRLAVIMSYVKKLLDDEANVQNAAQVITSKSEKLVLDVKEHEVIKDGEKIVLTPKEFEILKYFLTNKNVVLSREDFLESVWQETLDSVDARLVDTHIKKVRDKIKSHSIMTVRGYGYKWNEVEK